MKNILEHSDAEVLAEAHRLRSAYVLKRTMRYATTRDFKVHNESVAEHVFGLIFLAQYFLRAEPAAKDLNAEKMYTTLLFHDFPEIKYGDVTTYYKTKEHEEREKGAAKEVFDGLPQSLSTLGYEHWREYEEHQTPEALFAYALDKIEPLFELLDPVNERSIQDLKITYEMHVANKYKAAEGYPVLMRFVTVISDDMKKRGVFWSETV